MPYLATIQHYTTYHCSLPSNRQDHNDLTLATPTGTQGYLLLYI